MSRFCIFTVALYILLVSLLCTFYTFRNIGFELSRSFTNDGIREVFYIDISLDNKTVVLKYIYIIMYIWYSIAVAVTIGSLGYKRKQRFCHIDVNSIGSLWHRCQQSRSVPLV